MRAAGRLAPLVLIVALVFTLGAAVLRLPSFGQTRGAYEQRRAVQAVQSRHATNLDAFVNFDLRGFDTLGEEFIFLVAIAGFSLLLRERRAQQPAQTQAVAEYEPHDGEPVVWIASSLFVPAACIYGLYIVVHGQLTPGGGFQGGVVLATAALAIFLGTGRAGYERVFPKSPVEAYETLGGLGYVAFGFAGLLLSGSFMRNVLPLSVTGALVSGGTIDALNIVVGIAISGGFIVLFSEFIKEMRSPMRAAREDEPA